MLIGREQIVEFLDKDARDLDVFDDPRLLMVGMGIDPAVIDDVEQSARRLSGNSPRAAGLAASFFAMGLRCGLRLAEEN